MTPFVCAGAGFLLAVLWFDLMFDVQVVRPGDWRSPDEVLASIAAYYRRVTTAARPMNRLVAAVMVFMAVSIVVQIARGDRPSWVGWVALPLAAGPILLAGTRTVPSAVRLGASRDPAEVQARLARTIFRDHLVCAASISALLALELGFG